MNGEALPELVKLHFHLICYTVSLTMIILFHFLCTLSMYVHNWWWNWKWHNWNFGFGHLQEFCEKKIFWNFMRLQLIHVLIFSGHLIHMVATFSNFNTLNNESHQNEKDIQYSNISKNDKVATFIVLTIISKIWNSLRLFSQALAFFGF